MYEQQTVRRLYRRLISLYPPGFRERLGASMEQTFADLYLEHSQHTPTGRLGFVFWAFTETATGVVREHFVLITRGAVMRNILASIRLPAAISFLLILPFMIMEAVNRRTFREDFPIPLFVIMWLLAFLFIRAGIPIIRHPRAGKSAQTSPMRLLVRLLFLAFFAGLWVFIVIDQIPCFLGVPLCD